jgi:nucleotide-binding universal stress UspA family protein
MGGAFGVGKIVVGANDSGPSRAATDWAVERAAAFGLSIELIHVTDERWLGLDAAHDGTVREQAAATLDEELARVGATPGAPPIRGRVVTGLPPQALLDASADADLLVIGTHKTGFTYGQSFESSFLGIAMRARCDVVIVPEFHSRSRRGVVVAAQSALDGEPLRIAAREAARLGQQLVIVSAWDAASAAGRGKDGRAASLRAATSTARSVDAAVIVRPRQSAGTVTEALIAASAVAGLLVLARPGAEPDDPPTAIVRDVLANISSPVMVVGRHPEGTP